MTKPKQTRVSLVLPTGEMIVLEEVTPEILLPPPQHPWLRPMLRLSLTALAASVGIAVF